MAKTSPRDSEYLAPESAVTSRLSITKTDVFCFGELVLETLTGRRIWDLFCKGNDLIDYVARNWLEGKFSNGIDPRIDVDANLMTKFIEIGLLCVQKDRANRPTMEEVVDMLLGTLSPTLFVCEMLARINGVPPRVDLPVDEGEDYDTGAVEAFISELCPR